MVSGTLLTSEYEPSDLGPGRLLLRSTDPNSGDSRETQLQLDPEDPQGYRIEKWPEANALIIGGADRLVVIELATMHPRATIVWEYQECETQDTPWFTGNDDILLISSETRVFCLDRRLAFRWCWTTRIGTKEWVTIENPPAIQREVVSIALRSPTGERALTLRLEDATATV